ncbi:MAG: flavodoxin family protein [Candidatus Pseudomonas phytovorans]|uniref:Flavodoxin family protein n=1 Tax=Candidatus Pseudomonas phytovorans TaxID=3121377 RepID=A0AAJ6BBE7_9PSED|nr:flavodoxin family protein [Pseudomonas sp.]WEK29659.1 MAG: flavodoxin family protein [Pseudomonas sp.]
MNNVLVTFGTESGNAEMAADDIADILGGKGVDVLVQSMEDVSSSVLLEYSTVIVLTSTYGEGDLPETTIPFFDVLDNEKPDLGKIKFFAFGLGDSTYTNYNNAINIISNKLVELGATLGGEVGRHDAASGMSLTAAASDWICKVYP